MTSNAKKAVLIDDELMKNAKMYLVSYYRKNNLSEKLIQKYIKFHLDGVRRGVDIGKKIKFFSGKSHLKILDFGSGSGLVSYGISKVLRGEITGIDTDDEMIHISKGWLKKSKVSNINFINADIRKFDRKFDLIVCTDVLEHVPNRKEYLHILQDSLNPNGLLYIKTTNRLCAYNFMIDNHFMVPFVAVLEKNLRNKIISYLLSKKIDGVFDYSFKWELEGLFHDAGFQIVKDFRPFSYFLMAHEYLIKKVD